MCCCQFLILCLLVFVWCIEVLLCWVCRGLQLLSLPLGLIPYVVVFLISCNLLYFKVYFVWYEYCYSSFLLLPFCMEYVFLSSNFQSIYVLRSQVGFRIHSASLCLLVGAFNPFSFKIIIDIYGPIAIFLIAWSWFCRSFFFSCISWLYKSLYHLL